MVTFILNKTDHRFQAPQPAADDQNHAATPKTRCGQCPIKVNFSAMTWQQTAIASTQPQTPAQPPRHLGAWPSAALLPGSQAARQPCSHAAMQQLTETRFCVLNGPYLHSNSPHFTSHLSGYFDVIWESCSSLLEVAQIIY